MLKNYIKVAYRQVKKYKAYTYINVLGLAIGITCCLLILLYVSDEISYDNFFNNAGRIYRINSDLKYGGTELYLPVTSDMMGPILKKDYPQVEEYTRVYSYDSDKFIKKGDEFINENGAIYADSTFFRIFNFAVISGNLSKAFAEPNTVVLTETIAKKYFGNSNVAGKYFVTNERDNPNYKITAVIKDLPSNTHFNFKMIFPMLNLHYNWGSYVSLNHHTYLLLRKGTDYKELEKKLDDYNNKYVFPYVKDFMQIESREAFEKAGNSISNSLTPLTDIHLRSTRAQEMTPSGNIEYVYIFSAVAVFILLIACINFMNLTTARYSNRARETGIRKVLGTTRNSLILQFLTESVFLSFIAVIIALAAVYHLIPWFNEISGKTLLKSSLFSPSILGVVILLPVITGILAGLYPALFLSRFMPHEILKGNSASGKRKGNFRNILVIFQFASSVILITGTVIIYSQINFIKNKNLGYQKDQVLIINDTYNLGSSTEAFKDEMLKVAGVLNATVSGFLPVPSNRSFNGVFKDASMGSESGTTMQTWSVDYEYINTLGIRMKEGRYFSKEYATDSSSVILNESAAKQFGYANPLGETIYTMRQRDKLLPYKVIGVVKNFHYESMHNDIGPLCMFLDSDNGLMSFKIKAANVSGIINAAERNWKTLAGGMPFSWRFLDDSFSELYRADERIGQLSLIFSVLAIIIACLGLFGLANYFAEQRTKEIGVRKVLGASATSIFSLLSFDFLKWVIIANIIALPAAYFIMQKWLEDFAYRIELSWTFFAAAGIVTLIIALATVSIQTIRSANANPVKSLKYE
jgi:putative ABC transport system permease protein